MKTMRLMIILIALCLAGCTLFQSYSYKAMPVETLSQEEVRNIFSKLKVHLFKHGEIKIMQIENKNPDSASFKFGSFANPVELSYAPENGFILKFTRVASPLSYDDFSFVVEDIIYEVTSKNVQFHVVY
jgi:hypothetical protein